jgi:hypothetical protein
MAPIAANTIVPTILQHPNVKMDVPEDGLSTVVAAAAATAASNSVGWRNVRRIAHSGCLPSSLQKSKISSLENRNNAVVV